MRVRSIRNNRGAALVVVLFLMVFGTALVMLLSDLEIGSYKFVSYRGDWMLGQRIAEAGMAEAIREVNNDQDFDASGGLIGSIAAKNFNGGTYNVTASEAGGVWTLTSTATYQNPLEVITRVIQVVVRRPIDQMFPGGAGSPGDISVGNNAEVDSYDSADGPYDADAADDNGNVASNGDITLGGNATIKGNATPGPDGSVTLEGNNSSVSGSTTPATTNEDYPPVQMPAGYETWTTSVLDPDSSVTLPTGDYLFTEFELNSNNTLTIEGPATIVIAADALVLNSNAHLLIDGSGGPVNIYIIDSTPDSGSELLMRSNSTIRSTTDDPTDITIYVAGSSEITLNSNAQIYAGIYAPESEILVRANTEIFGAIVGGTIEIRTNAKIHFDKQLSLKAQPGAEEMPMEIQSWRVVQ